MLINEYMFANTFFLNKHMFSYFSQLNLQNEELLNQLHTTQEQVGFGNPIAV